MSKDEEIPEGYIRRGKDIIKKGGRPPKKATIAKRKAMLTAKARKEQMLVGLQQYNKYAISQLGLAVKQGKPWALKMYMEYYYGKPSEMGAQTDTKPKIEVKWSANIKPGDIHKNVTINVPHKEE